MLIMTFPTEGENHHNGIKNEEKIVDYLNLNPDCEINNYFTKVNGSSIESWFHKGGTTVKMDASYQLKDGRKKGISIKNHKTGTFDWMNTTKFVSEKIKKDVENFKIENKGADIGDGSISDELDNIFDSHLENNISSLQITELLDYFYKKEPETDHILINKEKTREYVLIKKAELNNIFNSSNNHEFILKSENAKQSRQIWIKQADGTEKNTTLRLRLTTNNGIRSLLETKRETQKETKKEKIKKEIIDQTLQILSYSDNIPLNYTDLKKLYFDYLIKEKKEKKEKKNRVVLYLNYNRIM